MYLLMQRENKSNCMCFAEAKAGVVGIHELYVMNTFYVIQKSYI